jgi:hypothetical protein
VTFQGGEVGRRRGSEFQVQVRVQLETAHSIGEMDGPDTEGLRSGQFQGGAISGQGTLDE